MNTITSTIEKTLTINAPLEKVWPMISTKEGICKWFCQEMEGEFQVGHQPTFVFVMSNGEKFRGKVRVDALDPKDYMAYRWRPNSDSEEPIEDTASTLVEFKLTAAGEATTLRMVESGFDRVPEAEREKALSGNTEGWNEELGELQALFA